MRIYTGPNYQRSATVSSLATNQFDFFYFSRDSSMLPGCPTVAIIVLPSFSGGNFNMFLSDRPFASTGGCNSAATLCNNGGYLLTLLSTDNSSTGFFYVAVRSLSAAAYTLALEWRDSSGACSVGMLYIHLHVHHRYRAFF